MRTPSRFRPSGRPSTTSRATSRKQGKAKADLGRLIDELSEERLRHTFTHASWADDRAESYERLEFLGDSVLGLAIARELYERFPDYQEGRLAKIRAHVVSRQSCAVVAGRLKLGEKLAEYAAQSEGAEIGRLATNRNVLAALVEGCLGALYLEHGFEPIREAIVDAFADRIHYAVEGHVDYKTAGGARSARPNGRIFRSRGGRPSTRPTLHVRRDDRWQGNGDGDGPVEESRGAGRCARGAGRT
jgi:ribonuclease III